MVLRSVAQGLKVPQIDAIVRESEATVLRGLKRDLAEGIEGLQDGVVSLLSIEMIDWQEGA